MLQDSEIQNLSDNDIEFESKLLNKERKRLTAEIDRIDTILIGLKEELRRRHEKKLRDKY